MFQMGLSLSEACKLRTENPSKYKELAYKSMARHVKAMVECQDRGAKVFDYGNNIRAQAIKRWF